MVQGRQMLSLARTITSKTVRVPTYVHLKPRALPRNECCEYVTIFDKVKEAKLCISSHERCGYVTTFDKVGSTVSSRQRVSKGFYCDT